MVDEALGAAVDLTGPALVNFSPWHAGKRRLTRYRIHLSEEDDAFLCSFSRYSEVSPGEILSRMWTLTCRALRTGRNPHTGFPILWHVPEMDKFQFTERPHTVGQRLTQYQQGQASMEMLNRLGAPEAAPPTAEHCSE